MTGFTILPLSVLCKAEWNYKEENSELSEKLLANFQKNGQIENIIVRELANGLYEVVNGNHRLDVMRDLAYTDVQVFNLGAITEEEAYRISLETNETKFHANPLKVSNILKQIHNSVSLEDMVKTLPYPQELIKSHITIGSKIAEFKPPIERYTPPSAQDIDTPTLTSLSEVEVDYVESDTEVSNMVCLKLNITQECLEHWHSLRTSLPELSDNDLLNEIITAYLLTLDV